MTAPEAWEPGDPVYPDQEPMPRQHCGPCLVAWSADTDRCPECGELSTEALRADLAALTSKRKLCECGHARRWHTQWAGCEHRSCRCGETPALLDERGRTT